MRSLFDDLVGPGQQRWRDRNSERLCGDKIDPQLEARRLLYGHLGGFRPMEDAIDKPSSTLEETRQIGRIGDHSTSLHIGRGRANAWQPVFHSGGGDLPAI